VLEDCTPTLTTTDRAVPSPAGRRHTMSPPGGRDCTGHVPPPTVTRTLTVDPAEGKPEPMSVSRVPTQKSNRNEVKLHLSGSFDSTLCLNLRSRF